MSTIQSIRSTTLGWLGRATFAAVAMLPCMACADVPADKQHEVKHLLHFVQHSACEMNRNGSFHSGDEAAAHIQKKYEYYRDEIQTVEDFIAYSATKSTMSGKYYTVKCGDAREITTQNWLLNELKHYRESEIQAHNKLQ